MLGSKSMFHIRPARNIARTPWKWVLHRRDMATCVGANLQLPLAYGHFLQTDHWLEKHALPCNYCLTMKQNFTAK